MEKKYIVLMGAELLNKGAQSMIFTVTNELRKRFPNKEIVLFSPVDYDRHDDEKKQYTFHIEKHPDLSVLFYLSGGIFNVISRLLKLKKSDVTYTHNILNKTDMMIDISGYALASTSGIRRNLDYLLRIKVAKKYNITTYVLPQSFGPFDYKRRYGLLINPMIKHYLKYPKVIFAREKEGYDLLTQKYKLKSVKLSNDIVLLNKSLDMKNIYNTILAFKNILIDESYGTVAIVPNIKNFIHGNKAEVVTLYKHIIEELLINGKRVYLIRHSFQDLEACEILKSLFPDNKNVILVRDDMNSFEFNTIVKKFDFMIASRYHSIVHAYKNGIPCIAIGWATKYHELLNNFKQEEYIFDVRNKIESNEIIEAIRRMINKHKEESKIISSKLIDIQKENLFDYIFTEV